jgi:outer membrane protein
MVFEKTDSGLVFAPASLDLTNELVRTYNDKFPSKGGAGGQSKGNPALPKGAPAPKK